MFLLILQVDILILFGLNKKEKKLIPPGVIRSLFEALSKTRN